MSKPRDSVTLSQAEAVEVLMSLEKGVAQCELHNRGCHHTIPDLTMKEIRHGLIVMASKIGRRVEAPVRAEEEKSQALTPST